MKLNLQSSLERLMKAIPPAKSTSKKVNFEKRWAMIKRETRLPDTLFPFFSTYLGGIFAVFDKSGEHLDNIYLYDVFNPKEYKNLCNMGTGFSETAQTENLAFEFFPEKCDGLFPIASTPCGYYLFFDQRETGQIHYFSSPFDINATVHCNIFDFLLEVLTGQNYQAFLPVEEGCHIYMAFHGHDWDETIEFGRQQILKASPVQKH